MAYTSWFFDKIDFKQTPSILDDISIETEQRYRREGARFINKVGTKMNLRYDTMATGVVYFHRFYMCHSFKQFPRYITACCCLFLAGKVEETPKKCKDIIKTAKSFITDAQFSKFGEDPKEEVLTLERILLQTINFDLQVDHPYNYLLKYAKVLDGDKEKLQKMLQMAWTFINDSMCTTISLQWEPEVIAIALMFLAGKLTKFEVTDWQGRTPRQQKWWDMFVEDVSTDLLEDICHQVLDLYSMPMPDDPQNSPPGSPTDRQDSQQPHLSNQLTPNQQQLTNPSGIPNHPAASFLPHQPPNLGLQPPIAGNAYLTNSIPTIPPSLPPNLTFQPQALPTQNPPVPNIPVITSSLPPPLLPQHITPNPTTGPPLPTSQNISNFYRPQTGPFLPTNLPYQNM